MALAIRETAAELIHRLPPMDDLVELTTRALYKIPWQRSKIHGCEHLSSFAFGTVRDLAGEDECFYSIIKVSEAVGKELIIRGLVSPIYNSEEKRKVYEYIGPQKPLARDIRIPQRFKDKRIKYNGLYVPVRYQFCVKKTVYWVIEPKRKWYTVIDAETRQPLDIELDTCIDRTTRAAKRFLKQGGA